MKNEPYKFCKSGNSSILYTAAVEHDADEIVNEMKAFLDFACKTVSNPDKIGLYILSIIW